MPDLLGAANPVPGYDKTVTNRNVPVSSENSIQLQNVPDITRVSRADGRTERQDSNLQGDGKIRYDSNFQTFLQALKETPDMAESLKSIFAGREGVTVLSGMQDGIAAEMAGIMEMLQMDEEQILDFLTGQMKLETRFGGELFALLRGAYSKAASEPVQTNILQFLKSYADYSSTGHIESGILRNLRQMADAMPARWAEPLREMIAQLENGIEAGDREGNIRLLQKSIFPHMSSYVEQTHDMGPPRQLLSMLALNLTRYENGSEEKLLETFHQLRGYGTLKNQLGGIDDDVLLKLLQNTQQNTQQNAQAYEDSPSPAVRFSNSLVSAAGKALRGEGSQEVQEGFRNLIAAMLINQSVYMPVNHYLLPLEWNGRMLFSELWVDPDAEDDSRDGGADGGRENTVRFLLKVDVQSLGLFDIVLSSRERNVDVQISCPESVAPFSRQIEQAVTGILVRHELTPLRVAVRKMERPVALTDVFPKIFEGRNSVDVKA